MEIKITVKPFSDKEEALYERWKEKWSHNKPDICLGVFWGKDENYYFFTDCKDAKAMYDDLLPVVGKENIHII